MKSIIFRNTEYVNVPGVFVGSVRAGEQHNMPDAEADALVRQNVAVYGGMIQSPGIGPQTMTRPGLYEPGNR